MINTISESDKIFSKVINSKPYFPNYLSKSITDETYEFMISSRYDNTTDEACTGVMLSTMFIGDDDSESSFLMSPETALELSKALAKAANHAKYMDDIKKDLKLSKYNLANLINRKLINKGKIVICMNPHHCDENTEIFKSHNTVYDVEVTVFINIDIFDEHYELHDDSSFSFEINLFKVLYSYAVNMIRNNLVDFKTLKVKNKSEPVHYFEVLKQFILMQIIKDIYINTDLYPGKELDELFAFMHEENIKSVMDSNIEMMIDLVREDLEQISNPVSKDMINIIPLNQNKNDGSDETKCDDNTKE